MPEPSSAPPNPYQSLATMPGAPPAAPKQEANTEELMKGFHGILKALRKMEDMEPKLSPKFAQAKKLLKEAAADALGPSSSGLDDDDSSSSTGSTPPAETPPPPDAGATPPPPAGPTS